MDGALNPQEPASILVLALCTAALLAWSGYTVRLERDAQGRSHMVSTWLGWIPIARRELGEITDIRMEQDAETRLPSRVVLVTAQGRVPLVPWGQPDSWDRDLEAARVVHHVAGADRVVVRTVSPPGLALGVLMALLTMLWLHVRMAALLPWI